MDEPRLATYGVLTHAADAAGATDSFLKSARFSREGGRKTAKRRTHAGVYDKADAEVELIVSLYFDGLTLSKIARMLGRSIDYVSRVFHSPRGQQIVRLRKRERNELAEELQDRVAYAAQASLDNIIAIANAESGSESVRLRANEYIVDRAMPVQARGAAVQVNIGDGAIELAMAALKEVDACR